MKTSKKDMSKQNTSGENDIIRRLRDTGTPLKRREIHEQHLAPFCSTVLICAGPLKEILSNFKVSPARRGLEDLLDSCEHVPILRAHLRSMLLLDVHEAGRWDYIYHVYQPGVYHSDLGRNEPTINWRQTDDIYANFRKVRSLLRAKVGRGRRRAFTKLGALPVGILRYLLTFCCCAELLVSDVKTFTDGLPEGTGSAATAALGRVESAANLMQKRIKSLHEEISAAHHESYARTHRVIVGVLSRNVDLPVEMWDHIGAMIT
jgi:hypothetical protein